MISHLTGAGPSDPSVGGEQRGSVPLGGGGVDRIGVAQRTACEHPWPMHVDPGCALDQDLEREVPGCGEWLRGRLGGERVAGRDPWRSRVGDGVDDERRVDDHGAGR